MDKNSIATTTMDIQVFNYLKLKNLVYKVCLRCVHTVQTKHINDFPISYLDLSVPERLNFIHTICENDEFSENLITHKSKKNPSPYSNKSNSKTRLNKESKSLKQLKRTFATNNRYRETSAAWGL